MKKLKEKNSTKGKYEIFNLFSKGTVDRSLKDPTFLNWFTKVLYIFVKVDGDILAFSSWKISAFKGLFNGTFQPMNERLPEIKCSVSLRKMKNEESEL